MKICEHENVCCPYCGSTSEPFSVKHDTTKEGSPTHRVHCKDCGGIFWVTCED